MISVFSVVATVHPDNYHVNISNIINEVKYLLVVCTVDIALLKEDNKFTSVIQFLANVFFHSSLLEIDA